MRGLIFVVSVGLVVLGASQVQAAASCSVFAKIASYDAEASAITIKVDKKAKERKFFPKPEGAPTTSKIPSKCRSSSLKQDSFPVTPTGGRMSITQVRENFSGKMMNDVEDDTWVGTELKKLVEAQTTVLLLLRQGPGGSDGQKVTTVYLPITEAELAEIARLESIGEDE